MSPEILLGEEFSLSTDVFSMGIILCEIAARKLADDYTFKRAAPTFAIDEAEVRRLLGPSTGCPDGFLQLALECLNVDPKRRPDMLTILERLRGIELEVLSRPNEADDVHVGSIKFMTGSKRPGPAPRIPSFGMGVGKDIRNGVPVDISSSDEECDEDELIEAIKKMDVSCELSFHFHHDPTKYILVDGASQQALLQEPSGDGEYSTTVIRSHAAQASAVPPSLSSILTIRSPQPTDAGGVLPTTASVGSIDSFHTASSSLSIAAATDGTGAQASTINGVGAAPSTLIHRFTLIKPGVKRQTYGHAVARVASPVKADEPSSPSGELWTPFGFFFSSALAAKCDLCGKRLGWKPVLECDDCGLRYVFPTLSLYRALLNFCFLIQRAYEVR